MPYTIGRVQWTAWKRRGLNPADEQGRGHLGAVLHEAHEDRLDLTLVARGDVGLGVAVHGVSFGRVCL